ncbi:unnamed protein product [Penicillium viridicatum]
MLVTLDTQCIGTLAANDLGIMELPRRKQELVIAGNDVNEELVVSSLLAFLEVITFRHPDVKCDWSARRRNLKAKFGASDLRAIVDGALVDPRNNNVKALIEAKKESFQGFGEMFLRHGNNQHHNHKGPEPHPRDSCVSNQPGGQGALSGRRDIRREIP